MILFIIFPFLGFYLGIQYQKIITPTEKSNIALSYNLPTAWQIFRGEELASVGYDPKTMTANAVTDMGTGLKITYGKMGRLYVTRFNLGDNPDAKGINSPQLLLEKSLNEYLLSKIEPKNVSEKTLRREYMIDSHPALFFYGVDENIGEIVGTISLGSNAYFLQFVSKGIPYSEFEKILGTIKI